VEKKTNVKGQQAGLLVGVDDGRDFLPCSFSELGNNNYWEPIQSDEAHPRGWKNKSKSGSYFHEDDMDGVMSMVYAAPITGLALD
jgi:hypothetical protein